MPQTAAPEASMLPSIPKTRAMRDIETDNDGKDIREIILAMLRVTQFNHEVAFELGIDESTLSIWILRLGIHAEARQIRHDRWHS